MRAQAKAGYLIDLRTRHRYLRIVKRPNRPAEITLIIQPIQLSNARANQRNRRWRAVALPGRTPVLYRQFAAINQKFDFAHTIGQISMPMAAVTVNGEP